MQNILQGFFNLDDMPYVNGLIMIHFKCMKNGLLGITISSPISIIDIIMSSAM